MYDVQIFTVEGWEWSILTIVGMVNIDDYVWGQQIKVIYNIINNHIDSWNVIDKHWL